MVPYTSANAFQRAFIRLAGTGPGSWLFARIAHRIDRPLYRLTRGRHTFASLLSGLPVVMLTTTGARSGRARTLPVIGLPTPEGLVVVASNYGQRHHPAWYHNLRADPTGEVAVEGRRWGFVAVEADGEQRGRIWRRGLEVYPPFATYERRASGRRIAVFVLMPAAAAEEE
ncbi:MAG: nitroreductase/quinone reductase family protein [Thermoleophilaceae bacterium]